VQRAEELDAHAVGRLGPVQPQPPDAVVVEVEQRHPVTDQLLCHDELLQVYRCALLLIF
jgi:hypothetical protein